MTAVQNAIINRVYVKWNGDSVGVFRDSVGHSATARHIRGMMADVKRHVTRLQ